MNKHNLGYVLGMHGDAWAIDGSRMRGYLDTLIVGDMTPEEIEARTGPIGASFFDCDGENLTYEIPSVTDPNCINEWPVDTLTVEAAVKTRKTKKAIAVVPVHGPMTNRSSAFTAFFGGTSTEKLGQLFDALIASPAVGAVIFDVDSPGGIVYGVPELAAKIHGARGTKPIVAVSNAEMFSAAYYLASAADQVVVTPSGQTGSIGVWSLHTDYSEALEQAGVKATFISAGERKVWGNPYEPLADEARAMLKDQVDGYYSDFVGTVAKHRGVTPKEVRDGFGRGGTVAAKDSKAQGLADRVDTLENTIGRLGGNVSERETIAADHERRSAEIDRLEG